MAGSEKGSAEITIASLNTEAHFREVVALQKSIWGFDDMELLPYRFFVVAVKIGGQLFGAFEGKKMIAFCLAIPGLKPGPTPYLHSHMLGVLPGYRDYGIGRRLKLHQREDALERGIGLIEWTFDPLEVKNAWFNLERLGAVIRRYVRNQYGSTTSPLHGGLPTDRCTAEWWIGSERVRTTISGGPVKKPAVVGRIELPADIGEIRKNDPERAAILQETAGDKFEEAFRKNLVVAGLEKTHATYAYLLSESAE